jgi:hypothetical protein
LHALAKDIIRPKPLNDFDFDIGKVGDSIVGDGLGGETHTQKKEITVRNTIVIATT